MAEATQTACFICRQRRGEAQVPGADLYADEHVVVVHAYHPERNPTPYLGHLLVEPRRHAPSVADIDADEAAAVGVAVARCARALKDSEGAEHVYVAVMGHHISHLHVHLIPRYPGTPREYWNPLKLDEWHGAKRGGPDEIDAVAARIRAAL